MNKYIFIKLKKQKFEPKKKYQQTLGMTSSHFFPSLRAFLETDFHHVALSWDGRCGPLCLTNSLPQDPRCINGDQEPSTAFTLCFLTVPVMQTASSPCCFDVPAMMYPCTVRRRNPLSPKLLLSGCLNHSNRERNQDVINLCGHAKMQESILAGAQKPGGQGAKQKVAGKGRHITSSIRKERKIYT